MSWSRKSKWIWVNENQQRDTYGEFYGTFDYAEGKVEFQISADSNYALFVNGIFVDSDQYPDFPHYKVYDKLDITEYCRDGKNDVAVVVWYYGLVGSQTYYAGNAALRFELYQNDRLCLYSDETILSRLSKSYQNHAQKFITTQIGYSFHYDATQEDEWKCGELIGFTESSVVKQELELYERPIKKLVVAERASSELLKQEHGYFLYDLGREEVGYVTIRVQSDKKQTLRICYGEHIVDGKVRSEIDGRDFSVQITVGSGVTEYTNYFRRLGLRYLEIWAEDNLEVDFASVRPCYYPVQKVEKHFDNELHQRIYDVSVRTLELCMHEHYEDCPWREQALYAMDSRNQMLCGYYAFKEFEFPRANLYLMSRDERKDGLLSICTPCDLDLTIPSFSLHYFKEVYEYTVYSGDCTLAKEIMPKLKSILYSFLNHMKDGLVKRFHGDAYWNFYEWTEGLAVGGNENSIDAALNCLLSIALQEFCKICDLLGEENEEYQSVVAQLNVQINKTFYRPESGLYTNYAEETSYSELVNSLMILCGAATGDRAKYICECMTSDSRMTKTSLSMMCFKYDALLKINKEVYLPIIIKDIEEKYSAMLEAGATSFWETELGEADFAKAGSLCHGWSAMPVYYLNLIG